MDILIDRRKFNKSIVAHSFILVMFVIFLFYFIPSFADGKQRKAPLYTVMVVMALQSIPILYRILKTILLKNSGLPAMSLQFGHLTDNTQLLFKVKDLDVRNIQSIERLRDSKNKQVRYKLMIEKDHQEGNFIKRLLTKRIILNDMLVDTTQLEELMLKIDREISGHLQNTGSDIRL